MTLILSTDDLIYLNSVALLSGPAVLISGNRIQFSNGATGTVTSSGQLAPAIEIQGNNALIINQSGGIISAFGASANTPGNAVAIQGSVNAERVENFGSIYGQINLGDGADYFLQASSGTTRLALGAGDDRYEFRFTGSTYSTDGALFGSTIDGGAGNDRLILSTNGANTTYAITNGNLTSFEELEVSAGLSNLQYFGGFQRVFLAPGAFVNFVDSLNPLVDLTLNNNMLGISRGSSFRAITGSDQQDIIRMNGGSSILGAVDLGGGSDVFMLLDAFGLYPTPVFGNVSGGAGTDTLQIGFTQQQQVGLAGFTGFESLSLGNGSGIPVNVTLNQANGFSEITANSENGVFNLVNSNSPLATVVIPDVFHVSTLTIDTGSSVASFGYGALAPRDPNGDATRVLTLTNSGIIGGDVRFENGNDIYFGRLGTTTGGVYGYAGDDFLETGAGNNLIDGGSGDDFIAGGAGSDVLVGGDGVDTLSFGNNSGAVYVDMVAGYANESALNSANTTIHPSTGVVSTDQFSGFENVYGSVYGDRIYGDDAANVIRGEQGNDIVYAGGGNDVIVPGTGSDVVIGGAGTDRLEYRFSTGAIYADLNAGFVLESTQQTGTVGAAATLESTDLISGIEDIYGSAYGDRLYGTDGANLFVGSGGDDIIYGEGGDDNFDAGKTFASPILGTGNDIYIGGAGSDTLDYSAAVGAIYSDLGGGTTTETLLQSGTISASASPFSSDLFTQIENLTGSAFGDRLYGDASGNIILGGGGDDYVYGGNGNDTISGGAGNDLIIGEGGADTLTGGAGADIFVFTTAPATGIDTITDFTHGTDQIYLLRSAFGLGIGDVLNFVVDGSATTASPTFIYNSVTGLLSFDADGNGSGVAIGVANVGVGVGLSAPDMVLYG